MIVGDTKPVSQIMEFIGGYEKILVVGCGGCVTVCFAGGETEVKTIANVLRIAFLKQNKKVEIIEDCVLRQCEYEFADKVVEKAKAEGVDAILSLACGVGVNFLATKLGPIPVFPGINTQFFGAAVEHGTWLEMCAGCGDCILHLTGGICPIARCTKSLMNGPCGGTKDGKCEISPEVECGWVLIINRMKELGTLDKLSQIIPPRDWSFSHHGGPRRMKKDLKMEIESAPQGAVSEKDSRNSR
jgi:ferredoxin